MSESRGKYFPIHDCNSNARLFLYDGEAWYRSSRIYHDEGEYEGRYDCSYLEDLSRSMFLPF